MSTDANPAESSPAVETAVDQAVESNDVAAFRSARLAERSGTPLSKPAEIDTAKPVDQDPSTEGQTAPASEPGKPRKNADTRVQELLADRAHERERAERAEARNADLERAAQPKPDVRPAPSTATGPAPFPPYDAFLIAYPDASYEDYLDARADYRADRRLQVRDAQQVQRTQDTARASAVQERDTKFRAQVETATTADPAFVDSLSEDVRRLKPFDSIRDAQGRLTEQPTGYHAIAEEIIDSPVAPQLMRHFSDHPEDLHRIAQLMPPALLKAIGRLEATFDTGETSAATPPKTVTTAPRPPLTLGKKPAIPANPTEAAVAADDVGAFRKARMAERVAALR